MYARQIGLDVDDNTITNTQHTLSSITAALNNNASHLDEMLDQLTNRLDSLMIHGPVGAPDVNVCGENSPAVNQLCDVNCKLIDVKEKIAYLLDRVQV